MDPAASLSDTLSFSKQKLSDQDFPDNSFDKNKQKQPLEKANQDKELQVQLVYHKFFEENFGHRISEKQLQQNLSQNQQQLQKSNLAQNTVQQLSLEQPSYTEKILNNELATNLGNKKSLAADLSFQSFFFDNLAFQKNFLASGKLVEKNFYKKQLVDSSVTQRGKGTCTEQLLPTCSPEVSDQKQVTASSFSTAAWFRRVSPKQLHTKNFPQLTLKEPLGRSNFFTERFQKHSLKTGLLQEHLCREQLPEKNF